MLDRVSRRKQASAPEHDPENGEAVFRIDHARTKSRSTIAL
jgi:hypothetical protein